jgi:hypothetical protein
LKSETRVLILIMEKTKAQKEKNILQEIISTLGKKVQQS